MKYSKQKWRCHLALLTLFTVFVHVLYESRRKKVDFLTIDYSTLNAPTIGTLIATENITDVSLSTTNVNNILQRYNVDESTMNVGILKLPQQNRSILHVHVGKCGGSTLYDILHRSQCYRKRLNYQKFQECMNTPIPRESKLSKLCWGEQHMGGGPQGPRVLASYNTFLFPVRDPIQRMVSAFNFLHPNNTASALARAKAPIRMTFYRHCFPSLQEFLIGLRRPSSLATNHNLTAARDDCRHLAKRVLLGLDEDASTVNVHLYHGYSQYHKRSIELYPDYEVLVTRMEHLWDDIKALDKALGGNAYFQTEGEKSMANIVIPKSKQNTYVSMEDKANLCCVMYKDMEAYQDIILRATNLLPSEKRSTLEELYEECQISLDAYRTGQATTESQAGFDYLQWEPWYNASCVDRDVVISPPSSSGQTSSNTSSTSINNNPQQRTRMTTMTTNNANKNIIPKPTKIVPGNVRDGQTLLDRQMMLPQQNRSILHVHVGKCGGSTLFDILHRSQCYRHQMIYQKFQECMTKPKPWESQLSKLCWGEQHMGGGPQGPRALASYNTFLFPVRDPIQRMVSAFNFLHPNNTASALAKAKAPIRMTFYRHCFPSLQEFLIGLRQQPSSLATNHKLNATRDDCRHLAKRVLLGLDEDASIVNVHLYHGYSQYHKRSIELYPDYEVLVTRMEHLWDDIKALDKALGGRGFFKSEGNKKKANIVIPKSKQNTYVSTEDKANLCCVMYKDMEAYQDIILRATNLLPSEKRSTLEELYHECKISTSLYETGQLVIEEDDDDDASTFDYLHWQPWYKANCAN